MTPLTAAAKAIYEEYTDIEYDGRSTTKWEDLDESSQTHWKAVASKGIKAYNAAYNQPIQNRV